jgi:hypothetical protein
LPAGNRGKSAIAVFSKNLSAKGCLPFDTRTWERLQIKQPISTRIYYDFLNFLNHRLHSIIKIIVQTRITRPPRPSFRLMILSTIHVQLSINLLPFQGVDGVDHYPPRCGGLACVALSGRKNNRPH